MTVSTLTVVPEVSASGTAPCAEPPSTSDIHCAGNRPRLLDLFCGGGGASAGYHTAGFDVVGVDIADQPDYPFSLIRADALDVLTDPGFLAGFEIDPLPARPGTGRRPRYCSHACRRAAYRDRHRPTPSGAP